MSGLCVIEDTEDTVFQAVPSSTLNTIQYTHMDCAFTSKRNHDQDQVLNWERGAEDMKLSGQAWLLVVFLQIGTDHRARA